MDKALGQHEKDLVKRKQFLLDNCDMVEEMEYSKQYTAEELQTRKDKLADVSIQLQRLEDEKKAWMTEWREQQKSLINERNTAIKEIKAKAQIVNEKCYKFVDPDERRTGYYNSEGILILERSINSEELQRTIAQANRMQMRMAE